MDGAGFSVELGDLAQCDQLAQQLGERVAGVAPEVAAAAGAFPGAVSATLLEAVQEALAGAFAAWGQQSRSYGERLGVAGEAYRNGDETGGRGYDQVVADTIGSPLTTTSGPSGLSGLLTPGSPGPTP